MVIGRDLRADVRVGHPLISRAHLIVRFDQGRWVAIDNGSLNGMYVNNRRVPDVDIQDGQRINIGNPDGPALTFEVGRHQGSVGRPPQTTSIPMATPSGAHAVAGRTRSRPRPGQPVAAGADDADAARVPAQRSATRPSAQRSPRGAPAQSARRRAIRPAGRSPSGCPPQAPQIYRPTGRPGPPAGPRPPRRRSANIATSMMKILRPGKAPGSETPGRRQDRPRQRQRHRHSRRAGIAPPRHPGARRPTAPRSIDNRSINGTFVNGTRVEQALLHDGDVVTIGNIDLVFAGGTLARRQETAAATRTGGLDVRGGGLDDREQQDAAGRHLADRAAGNADGRHRSVGCGQVDLRPAGGRVHPTERRHGGVRGSQHSRRIRLAAQQDRDGAAGRRGARSADREAGADVRRRTAAAARHHQDRP